MGPGLVQHFDVPTELGGWVLCVRPNQRPVAVAGEGWQALQDEGSGAPDGDALGALGFPAGNTTTTRVGDRQTARAELSGGRWGPGWLRRASDGQGWRWEPMPKPDTTMSASSRNWTSTPTPPQLRARVLATLPWADTDDLAITTPRLEAFVHALPFRTASDPVRVTGAPRTAKCLPDSTERRPFCGSGGRTRSARLTDREHDKLGLVGTTRGKAPQAYIIVTEVEHVKQ